MQEASANLPRRRRPAAFYAAPARAEGVSAGKVPSSFRAPGKEDGKRKRRRRIRKEKISRRASGRWGSHEGAAAADDDQHGPCRVRTACFAITSCQRTQLNCVSSPATGCGASCAQIETGCAFVWREKTRRKAMLSSPIDPDLSFFLSVLLYFLFVFLLFVYFLFYFSIILLSCLRQPCPCCVRLLRLRWCCRCCC